MKFLIGIPLIFLAIAVIAFLVVFQFILRFWLKIRKHMRGEFTDEEVERLSKKYHKQGSYHNNFSRDYFKRRDDSNTNSYRSSTTQSRTTHSDAGVTIIDDRDPDVASRKIFNKNEGEYVDFKEEA